MPDVPVGGFSSAYAAAAAGTTLSLLPGTHGTSGVRTSIGKRLIIQAKDWDPATTPGKYVTGSVGHEASDFTVQWQGGISVSAAEVVFRGISFVGNISGGAGSWDIDANSVVFEDCRFTDNFSYIGVHIGATGIRDGVTFRRCRFRKIGERSAHDHPIYAKTARNLVVEDCIFYECAGYSLHAYTDCDNSIMRRCVFDRVNSAVTYSGDSSNTVQGGYQYSTGNVIEDSILSNGKGGGAGSYGGDNENWMMYLVDYWYGGTAGVNYIRRSNVWMPTTPANSGRIRSGAPIQVDASVINVDPQYRDPANGDFTLAATSPCIGMGPTQIQPGGAPPAAAPPVTNLAAVAGDTSVALTWTVPASMDGSETAAVKVVRSETGFITDPTGVNSIHADSSYPFETGWTDTSVVNGTTYYYSVFAVVSGRPTSLPAMVAATPSGGTPPPPPPPPSDPTGGDPYIGKATVGGTWRGMSGDYKRASAFGLASGKTITAIGAYLRGTGTAGTTAVRPFVYDAASGALLGVCTAQNVSNALTEQWVIFTPASPIPGPSNGGNVRIGLHTASGDLQVAAAVVTGALAHGADTYADGTEATWASPATDTYELSIFAKTGTATPSAALAGTTPLTLTASGNVIEIPGGVAGITDVVYRQIQVQRTYSIPTPFQISTGAELRWDSANQKFVIRED